MSRTKKGSKGPGYEYWSRREGNKKGGLLGRSQKKITLGKERAKSKLLIKREKSLKDDQTESPYQDESKLEHPAHSPSTKSTS